MQPAFRPSSVVRLGLEVQSVQLPVPRSAYLHALGKRDCRVPRINTSRGRCPAWRRALIRRLTVTIVASIVLLATVLAVPGPVGAEGPYEAAINTAIGYLETRVTPEGGLDAFGNGPDPSTSARAVIALASAGLNQALLAHPETGKMPLDFVITTAITYTHEPGFTDAAHLFPGNVGLAVAALAAAGRDPGLAPDADLVDQLEMTLKATGAYSTTATAGFTTGEALAPNQAWAILGLSMAARLVPLHAVQYLVSVQDPDGSWLAGDPDTTGLAIVALMSTGQVDTTSPAVVRGLSFLRRSQLDNGGWRPGWDTEALNPDSTAWAIQSLLSCGYSPPLSMWKPAAPVAALASLQQSNGSVGGQYASAYSTAEALLGMAPSPLFLSPALRIERGLAWLASMAVDPALTTGMAVDMATAFAAAGYDPGTVAAADGSLMEQIARQASAYAQGSVDQAGKLALLLAVTHGDQLAGDLDLAAIIASGYEPAVGAYGVVTNTYHQAYGMLGTIALGDQVPSEASNALLALQQPDGGWKYDLSEAEWNTTTPDNTGLALQALLAAGSITDEPGIQRALAYLRTTRDDQGDWGNANATAVAVQALIAARRDLNTLATAHGRTPLLALAQYGKLDGPAVWMWESPFGPPVDNALATVQYVPGLTGQPLLASGTSLTPYQPVSRGPDPDRLILGEARFAVHDGQVMVSLPISSDQDGDATVTVAWLAPGMAAWEDATDITRTAGEISAALPVSESGCYLVRFVTRDLDGIEHHSRFGRAAVILAQVPPETWLRRWASSGAATPFALDYWVR